MRTRWSFGILGGLVATASCMASTDDPWTNENEEVGQVEQTLPKGFVGAANGDTDYCNNPNPALRCVAGEGDCDTDAHCLGGTVCGVDNGPGFGMGTLHDVCVVPHCRNGAKDVDETHTDCGGADCGTACGYLCVGIPANGQSGHCRPDCPCPSGQGDCNTDADCATGLTCAQDVGATYGFTALTDVCRASTCSNGVKDGDEVGVDCGGTCSPCSPASLSAVRYGGTSNDFARSIAIRASNGEFVVAGRFLGTTNLGGANLTRAGTSSSASDVFVAKYDVNGTHLWSKRFGGDFADGDAEVGVAIDANGNVALVGNYYLTVDFGGGPFVADAMEMFLVYMDTNGNHVWSKSFGGPGNDQAAEVAFDSSGNVLIAGSFQNSVNFGGSVLTSAAAGTFDIGVAKFTSAGAHTWSKRFGGTGNDMAEGIATDLDRWAHVVGSFSATMAVGSTTLTSAGLTDGFVTRLHPNTGAPSFANQYGAASNDLATDVAVDNQRRPVVVGYFKRTVDFGGGPLTAAGTTDKTDAFAVALTSTGAFRWANGFGGTDHDQALGVTVNPGNGDAAVMGILRGTVPNFAADGSSTTSAGGTDGFVAHYGGAAGALISSQQYGGTLDDVAIAAAYRNANLFVTGYFRGANVNFGGVSLSAVGSGSDIFITKIGF